MSNAHNHCFYTLQIIIKLQTYAMLYTKLRKKQKMERFLYFDKMRFCLTKLTTTNYNGTVRGENTNIALIKPFSRNRLLWVFIGATSTHTTPHRPCHAMPCHTIDIICISFDAMNRMWIGIGVGSVVTSDAVCIDLLSTTSIFGCEIGWKQRKPQHILNTHTHKY